MPVLGDQWVDFKIVCIVRHPICMMMVDSERHAQLRTLIFGEKRPHSRVPTGVGERGTGSARLPRTARSRDSLGQPGVETAKDSQESSDIVKFWEDLCAIRSSRSSKLMSPFRHSSMAQRSSGAAPAVKPRPFGHRFAPRGPKKVSVKENCNLNAYEMKSWMGSQHPAAAGAISCLPSR